MCVRGRLANFSFHDIMHNLNFACYTSILLPVAILTSSRIKNNATMSLSRTASSDVFVRHDQPAAIN